MASETNASAYDLLKSTMQKEIAMMREILANMHEEELSLLTSDKMGWARAMQTRSDLITELSTLRKERHIAMTQIEEMTRKRLKRKQPRFTLDELLPLEEASSCEIRSLLDQVIALVDRLNLQNSRNDSLFYQAKSLGKLPMQCAYPHPQAQARSARRKTRVATQ